MITPPYLQQGDKIAIIATARKISPEEMLPAKNILSQWGLRVVEGKNLYKQHYQFAGTDKERLEDFQNVLDDKEIKAVLFARGGYGTMRLVHDTIFSKFAESPKWLIGFSDITTLHFNANELGIETIHAPMAFNFSKSPPEILMQLKNILFGEKISYSFPKHEANRNGKAKGILAGGNLSLIYAENASDNQVDFSGKILFIEDLDEYLYHIDRMMMSLERSDRLRYLAGLVVGAMSDMRDNTKAYGFATDNPFGKTAVEIVSEFAAKYNFPVCFNFPAGHIPNNHPLILGREVELNVGEEVTLRF